MILEKVIINNFLSIEKATVLLKDRGLSSIEGMNLDGAGADSNGSGKSTLINAILWCNYGDPGKDLDSVDHVVRKKAGKDCFVRCIWYDEVNDKRYDITRYRKHPTFKNIVTVTLLVKSGDHDVSLTMGTDKDTQKVIEDILGADQRTFEAACFARQDEAPDIPGMTDGELKSLLEKVLPFEDMTDSYKQAQSNLAAKQGEIASLERAFDEVRIQSESAQREYYRRRDDIDGWEEKVENLKYEKENEICELESQIEEVKASMKPQDKIDVGIEKYTRLCQQFDIEKSGKITYEFDEATKAFKKAAIELRDIDHLSTCDKCGQAIGDKESLLEELTRVRDRTASTYNAAKIALSENDKAKEEYATNFQTLGRLQQLDRHNKSIAPKVARLEALIEQAKVDRDMDRPNPHIASYERLKGEIDGYEEQLFNMANDIQLEQLQLPVLEAVVETFSPKGLRYHFLETVTPTLDDSTNKYLKQLTDGKLVARWSTVTKLKNGDYREKFSITVHGDHCNGYGSLSGGEKRKVRLACFFALQDLIATRATKDIKLWAADEIDHALDASGLERLMSILHDKVSRKGTIVVISHNELKSWIPNATKVVKENGVSKITGYLSDS